MKEARTRDGQVASLVRPSVMVLRVRPRRQVVSLNNTLKTQPIASSILYLLTKTVSRGRCHSNGGCDPPS